MKYLLILCSIILLQGCSSMNEKKQLSANSSEALSAETVVNSIAKLADDRKWDELKNMFSDRVVLNYGFPELLTPSEIISRWNPLLSSFDKTEHHLKNIKVTVKDGRVLVTSDFTAEHVLQGTTGGNVWTLEGKYEYELEKTYGSLKVMRMKMIATKNFGNLEVLKEAQKRAGYKEKKRKYTALPVDFKSGEDTLMGLLFEPAGNKSKEIIIVTGSWTTVKEQMPMNYAEALARIGLKTFIFDFKGFGESEGTLRNFESPIDKTKDINSAVTFIKQRYPDYNITLLGICASSGYVAEVASRNPNVKRVALIAPWLHNAEIVKQVYGALPGYGEDGVAGRIEAAKAANQKYQQTGVMAYVPIASQTDNRAAMFAPVGQDWLDYYLNSNRGAIPQWGNRFAVGAWDGWLNYDALKTAHSLKVPTLIVHSEQGAVPQGTKLYISKMKIKPEVHWIEGSQFDFYDGDKNISFSVDFIEKFIK